MPEVWQPIPGFDGYEASSEGRIRSPRKILSQGRSGKRRYFTVWIRAKLTVHTLVASAFHGERPEGLCCCHRDDNPLNNRPENLYWGTHQQNASDKVRNGNAYKPKGELHPSAQLSEEDVQEIRRRLCKGDFQRIIAADYGLDQSTISDIKTGRSWSHLPWTCCDEP